MDENDRSPNPSGGARERASGLPLSSLNSGGGTGAVRSSLGTMSIPPFPKLEP